MEQQYHLHVKPPVKCVLTGVFAESVKESGGWEISALSMRGTYDRHGLALYKIRRIINRLEEFEHVGRACSLPYEVYVLPLASPSS